MEKALRSPSGGNVQPWKMYVLGPMKRDELVEKVTKKFMAALMGDKSQFEKSRCSKLS